jgi:DDE superfamily endonuclease
MRSKNFAARVAEIRAELPPDTSVEVWFQDEMRVGQKNKLTYRWAKRGSRPRAIHDQRTQSTYLFGAVCPELGTGAALVLPACYSEAMQLHLDKIAKSHLAVHAPELAVESDLQILRRYRRSLQLCLERPHRPALENHAHRSPRSGRRPPFFGRVGIRLELPVPASHAGG